MKDAACQDCKRRHIGCHSVCEDYKKYRQELDELNKKRREDKNLSTIGYIPKKRRTR